MRPGARVKAGVTAAFVAGAGMIGGVEAVGRAFGVAEGGGRLFEVANAGASPLRVGVGVGRLSS